MSSEDETWTQTLITITPEEDATIRELSNSVTVSSTTDSYLDLDPDNIVYRRSFTNRQFIDSAETETETEIETETEVEVEVEIETEAKAEVEAQAGIEIAVEVEDEVKEPTKQDAENQTYLEGIPSVYISVEYQDESSQTMYMSPPCPPLKYFRDIMTSMTAESIPRLKKSNVAATIISFPPEAPDDFVLRQLAMDVTEEERENFVSELSSDEETEMEITQILHFVIARVFWIKDPASEAEVDTSDKSTQTEITYNHCTQTFVTEKETQTELTCEPKASHTELLTDYLKTKTAIYNHLEECIAKAIDVRIIIDDIIDEIVVKCVERIRYPMKEQDIQTIATYKFRDEKEEDVLRKLRLDIIVDPFEASIVVVPLMDNLVHLACETVSKDAEIAAQYILNVLVKRVSTIIIKLLELQKESRRKPIDEILAKRKEKILEWMSKRETETISTQTSIAAIVEVKKIKKSQEILCSVCRRQSMCQWCLDNGQGESASKEEFKILRTQDILLAYKPCYIVTKSSAEREKYALVPPCPEKTAKPVAVQPRVGAAGESEETICVNLQGKDIGVQESLNEWSYVPEATIMKPISLKESVTSSSQSTVTFMGQSTFKGGSTQRSDALSSQAANALQILKNTFCKQGNCATMSVHTLKRNNSFTDNDDTKSTDFTCSSRSNIANNNKEIKDPGVFLAPLSKAFSKAPLPKTNTYSICSHRKSCNDPLKIVPVCVCEKSNK